MATQKASTSATSESPDLRHLELPPLPGCLPLFLQLHPHACVSVCSAHSTHSSLQNTAGERSQKEQALTQEGTWADSIPLGPAGCLPWVRRYQAGVEAPSKGPLFGVLNWPAAQGRPCLLLHLVDSVYLYRHLGRQKSCCF